MDLACKYEYEPKLDRWIERIKNISTKKEKKVTVTHVMQRETWKKLQEVSRKTGVPMSQIIESLLLAYFDILEVHESHENEADEDEKA